MKAGSKGGATMKKQSKKAFTVIELVIVIAVIAILAAVLIPTFASLISDAQDAAASAELRDIQINVEMNLARGGNSWVFEDEIRMQAEIRRNADGRLWAIHGEGVDLPLDTALNICPELDSYGRFDISGDDLIYTGKGGGKAVWQDIVGERPPEHTHVFVDGACNCGAIDPSYGDEPDIDVGDNEPDIEGEVPDIGIHEHNYVDGACDCGDVAKLQYTRRSDGCYVSGIGTHPGGHIEIPEEYEGEPVVGIAKNAFYGISSVRSVSIPDSVKSIGDFAFCITALTEVVIPDSVTNIGEYAFYGCSQMSSIRLPEGIEEIKLHTFSHTALGAIEIPESVTRISSSAFYACFSLTEVSLPDSLKQIGPSAFRDCISLTSIVIPDSVAYIGDFAFYGCRALTDITLPSGLTTINAHIFANCDSLQSVQIPSAVTSIKSGAFQYCKSLTIVGLPASLTEIGGLAFAGCTSLAFITIPHNVSRINGETFSGCTNLRQIDLPTSITYIGSDAIKHTASMLTIKYSGDAEQWAEIERDPNWDRMSGIYIIECVNGEIIHKATVE